MMFSKRVSMIFVIVCLFFYSDIFLGQVAGTTPPTTYPFMGQPDACYAQLQNYNSVRNSIASKCGGVTEKVCMEEAKQCAGDDPDLNTSPLLGTMQNTLLAGMTGGYPIMGATGANSFKCLPSSRLDQVRSQFEKLRTEAQSRFDKAQDYKRKIEEEAKEINKSISEMKKTMGNQLKDRQKAKAELPIRIREIRDKATEQAEQIQEAIDSNTQASASKYAEIDVLEAQRGALYVNTVGKCTDELTAGKENALVEHNKKVQEFQSKMVQVYNINEQQKLKREFLRYIHGENTRTMDFFKNRYQKCLMDQTVVYNAEYKNFTNKMNQATQEIDKLKKKTEGLFVKLQNIPKSITEGVNSLKQADSAEMQSAANEMAAMQQEIKQSMQIYESKYSEANRSFMEAQVKQQMAQMQQMTNQSLYHMNTFGDAAPWLQGIERVRRELCDMCGSVDPSVMRKRQEESNSNAPQININYRAMCSGSGSGADRGSL